ncbi:thioredoxin family protein [Sulfurospirillum arcachonense]|uniref:thioredoxin family protein n=1 Tax=Sulfurospirillum arcachonense TaxID=57666 RepID=UPI000469EE9B|nr:thioredoxin family protein [Sulfurospirillum arcachonense]
MWKKISLIVLLLGFFSSLYALDISEESKKAISENKLVLLSVESRNCGYCVKMNKEIFSSNIYAAQIAKNYVQKIIYVEETSLPRTLQIKYFPTNVIVDPKKMEIVDEFTGYMPATDFIGLLDLVYKQEFQIQ